MSQLTSLWHYLSDSPNFVPGVVGVAASAAGAWGAQIAILRLDRRRERLASLRAVNEALALSFSIGNTFMSIKNQHLMGMLERFHETETSVRAHLKKVMEAEPGTQFEILQFGMELHTLPIVTVPIERLEAVVFEKLSVDTKTLNLVIEVGKSINMLNASLGERNELIQKWKNAGKIVPLETYLGIEGPNGADETYKMLLNAIGKYCDDCIHFSMRLQQELNTYGNKIRKTRLRVFNPLPKIASADYSSERAKRLLPDPNEYKDWESGFAAQPTFWDKVKKRFSREPKPVIGS